MKQFYMFSIVAALCSGCVSHRSCVVTTTPSHTDLEVRKDWYGLVPGICGFTTHVCYDYTFRLAGQRTEYADSDIQEISVVHRPSTYTGTVSVFRDQKRAVVKLRQGDAQFELNGKYWYH